MMKWLNDTLQWLKTHWLEWILVIAYVGVLYWMAGLNWQVILFPIFFIILVIMSLAVIISFRYIKTPLK